MKLPDFLEFEPFNRLREMMGAEELGDFVFFDPKKNLTGLERLELADMGVNLSLAQLWVASDDTLVLKDSRVIIYTPVPEGLEDWQFHLADCAVIQKARSTHNVKGYRAVTTKPVSAEGTYKVCSGCLQKLHYQNFDGARQRHRDYSQRVEADFDVRDYFQRYPMYPVSQNSDTPLF